MSAATTLTAPLSGYADGIYYDIPEAAYHAPELGVFSQSAATALLRSPAHYRAWLTSGWRRSPALDLGKAAHCALLEPDRFVRTYVVEPDFGDCRFKENRAARDKWRAEAAGATLVSADDFETIRGIARSIERHPTASRLLLGGRSEVTILWTCPETGVRCKGRIDHLHDDIEVIADLKTLEDASPKAFVGDSRRFGYRRQARHYIDGLTALGYRDPRFLFVLGEKPTPYAVRVGEQNSTALAHGGAELLRAKRTLARCLETNEWPAYGDDIDPVGIDRWETIEHG